jgi:hypothetical protein
VGQGQNEGMETLLGTFLAAGAVGGIVYLFHHGIRALFGDESGSHDPSGLNSTDQDGRNSVQREKAICSDCRDRIATYINPPLCRTCRARRSPNWFRAVKKPVTKKKSEQGDAIADVAEDLVEALRACQQAGGAAESQRR